MVGGVNVSVREMQLDEVDLVIDYFHSAAPEFLETLGVDPTRLPDPVAWRGLFADEFERPVETRGRLLVIWESQGDPVGFSSADKIVIGAEAYMHLHVLEPDHRRHGTARNASDKQRACTLKRCGCSACSVSRTPSTSLRTAHCSAPASRTSRPT